MYKVITVLILLTVALFSYTAGMRHAQSTLESQIILRDRLQRKVLQIVCGPKVSMM